MCRTTEFHGVQFVDRRRRSSLLIKSFHVRFLSGLKKKESLTLRYLPRVNGGRFMIDGSKVKSDSDALLTLYRIVHAAEVDAEESGVVVFGSRERVRVSEGVRFEVYSGEDRILEGRFGKDEEEEWKVLVIGGGHEKAVVVEVCVAVEGGGTLTERVVVGRRKAGKRRRSLGRLEVIPEVDDESGDGCSPECVDDDHEEEEEEEGGRSVLDGGDLLECCGPDVEGVGWAIDVGIWVVCLGVGLVVSKASAKSMRRLRIL